MASTAGTCHWVTTAPDGIGTTDDALSSRPRCLFRQSSALPAPQYRGSAVGIPYTLPAPPPVKMLCQQATNAWPKHTSLQFEPMWTCTTRTADQTGLTVSLAFIWAHAYQSFLPIRCWRSKCHPWCLIELCCAQSAQALCSACSFLSPLGGEVLWTVDVHFAVKLVRYGRWEFGKSNEIHVWCGLWDGKQR